MSDRAFDWLLRISVTIIFLALLAGAAFLIAGIDAYSDLPPR
jgi:hypothetical protein